jgi:hypothetical protein|tara:strand:+ start:397 stop:948 length:552 start_codon:yes stop_codon:yes gene_type:complete
MTKTKTAAEELTNREESAPVFEEGFTPVSHVIVVKKNQRYVAVVSKNIAGNELIEKCGFAPTPYKTKEPDQRAQMLASFLPVMPCSCQSCQHMGPTIIVPTGNMIFFQFSTKSNTKIEFDGENGIISIRATHPMKKGDELFIDYTSLYPQGPLEQESMFAPDVGMDEEKARRILAQGGMIPGE